MRPLISSLGKLKTELNNHKLIKRKSYVSRICLNNSGQERLSQTKKLSVKNSYLIVREISSSSTIMQLKESLEKFKKSKKKPETNNFSKPLLKEKELWLKSKIMKNNKEEERLSSFNNITSKRELIKRLMKNWSTSLCNKKLRDNTKWERLNGKEKNKQESIFLRMCTRLEKRIFCSNKLRRGKWSGSKIMKDSKLKLLLRNRMLSLKPEQQKRPLLERITRWISLSKWTRKIEFKEPISKRKCMRKEQLNWLNLNIKGKSTKISRRTPPCSANGNPQ